AVTAFDVDSVLILINTIDSPVDVYDGAADGLLPAAAFLSQNYPNPFNPATAIEFSLPGRARATVMIFNIKGQQVRRLLDEERPAGNHVVFWDGRDDSGNQAATGVYLYRLQAGEVVETRKMLLLK
ncbi:MAG: T9SS type A sorting domain-containing protein, partial [Candidatus Zixiibacteriota bacterium]